ncbi:MAG: HAD-IC family P-type ATPase [Actinomycetia bacterium]|nr:HAD-IC family P-type ATPase [Actinomycetes bacterium]
MSETERSENTQPLADTQTGPLGRADLTGLSEEEAQERLARRGPIEPPATSRSLASILRANVFTVFNLILVTFGGLTLYFGHFEDALFLAILVGNAGIGIIQEYRAKIALDSLAALVAPRTTVVRSGNPREVPVAALVVGDLVRVKAGDQVVADGRIEASDGLRLDESNLTGEAEAVARFIGEEVRSGAFVVEGAGSFIVTAVGPDSYAERVANVARQFRHPRSPLELALNRLLIVLVVFMVPLGIVLGAALFEREASASNAVTTSVAAVVTMIPEGLILLTSLTYAVAALRMTRRGALTQQLSAIESIASAEVICLDKTGTLTESALRVVGIVPHEGVDQQLLNRALARYAASSPSRNATIEAVAESMPTGPEEPSGHVPFSSRRRWSGVRIGALGLVLGAPEHFPLGGLAERVAAEQRAGRRVIALGTTASRLDGPVGLDEPPPSDLALLGVVFLAERIRTDASKTVAFFTEQGVELKVLSGDAPETVAAIARDVGIPVETPVDGSDLPDDPIVLRRLALEATAIGRISPEGKRRVVEALRDAGRYVAMVGDGVNDVPALKAARMAIAPGSGTQMAKSVADLVLVRGDFSSVPALVGEGRKILRNLQRVTKLFVAKSVFAAFAILTVGISNELFPLLPRHLTLVSTLAVGFPAFFLALAPSSGPWRQPNFLRETARFAVPAGTAAGLGVVSSFLFAQSVIDLQPTEAQTVAATVLLIVGLYFILVLEASGRGRGAAILGLCGGMLALYGLMLATPGFRSFFDLAVPSASIILTALAGSAIAILGLVLTDNERFVPGIFKGMRLLRADGRGSGGGAIR